MNVFLKLFLALCCSVAFFGATPVFSQTPCIDPALIDSNAVCAAVYDPVCGCDGVTYGNACVAEKFGGVTSWTPGECQLSGTCPEYCTTEFEYSLNGTALHAKFDFGDVDPPFFFYAQWSLDGGAVTGTGLHFTHLFSEPGLHTLCATYPTGDFTPETCTVCKAIEIKADCVDSSQVDPNIPCPTIYDPVCACDGVTYPNDCIAKYHFGVSSWTPGPCQGACFSPSWVDFNKACIEIYDPVCGCDGNDYDNWCHAVHYGGVRSWAKGKCCNDKPCEAKFEVEYLSGNKVVLHNGSVNAHATSVDFGDGSPVYQGQVFDTLSHQYFFPGTYQICLEISDFTGACTDFVCKVVQFLVGTNEPANGRVELSLWPNPTSGRVQVQVAEARPNMAQMFDVFGKLVWEKRVSSGQFEVDAAGLPSGVYMLQVLTDRGVGTHRLVVSQ